MINFNLLAGIVEEFSKIKKEDLVSKRRFRHLVELRMMCSNLMKESHNTVSLERIGNFLNVDHATVLYHIKQHKMLMRQKDTTYRDTYEKIKYEYTKASALSGDNVVAELLDKKYKLEKMLEEVNEMLNFIEQRPEYVELKT